MNNHVLNAVFAPSHGQTKVIKCYNVYLPPRFCYIETNTYLPGV